MKQLREAQIRHDEQRKEDLSHALEPATTTDGHHVEVAANIGGVKEAGQVAELGGDGVGLLRSEFLFYGALRGPKRRRAIPAIESRRPCPRRRTVP